MEYITFEDLIRADISANESYSVLKYLDSVEQDYKQAEHYCLKSLKTHNKECEELNCSFRLQAEETLKVLRKDKRNIISFRSKLRWLLKQNAEEI